MFGRRAASAALGESPPGYRPDPGRWRFEPPTERTRDAVWRLAGPVRRAAGLAELDGDPYPLASAIASCALRREESRGGHLRSDFPDIDAGLDRTHIVFGPDGATRTELWS